MRTIHWLLLTGLVAFNLHSQTNPVPVRLAIVPETPDAKMVAELLTAEFTKNGSVHLLEREEIQRVYYEQGLSAANHDDLKLGSLLGADGLLSLGISTEGGNQFLNIRLMAVKPGVVLVAERLSWPMKDLTGWSPGFVKRLDVFRPKLAVLGKDAIPLSVVNLRSAVQSEETKETERQLKLLTIQRLSQEPQLFVLERQQLQMLSPEKELKSDESAFWNGSYLLEGTIDQNGYSKDTITINARLTPPKGGAPMMFEARGSRTNLAESVNLLANKVVAALKVNSTTLDWNAADEATQFSNEAKWAYRWGLYREAQEASESAWALGIQTKEMALLRLESYQDAPPDLPRIIRVVELFNQYTRRIVAEPGASDLVPFKHIKTLVGISSGTVYSSSSYVNDPVPRAYTNHVEWFDRGTKALNMSSALLKGFNESAEARSENKQQLSELRALTRQLESVLETNIPADICQVVGLKWKDGGLWYDTPEQSISMYSELVQKGSYPVEYTSDFFDDEFQSLPRIVAWSWEDRKRIPGLLRQFVNNLTGSTNQELQLLGLYYTLILTPDDGTARLDNVQKELYNGLWERRDHLFRGEKEVQFLGAIERSLSKKFGMNDGHFYREPFISFRNRLLQDYLTRSTNYSSQVLSDFFDPMTIARNAGYFSTLTDSEKSHLILMLEDFKKRLNLSPDYCWDLNNIIAALAGKDPYGFNKGKEPPPAVPRSNAKNSVVVAFKNWNLDLPVTDPDTKPEVRNAIYRHGKLWLQILCSHFGTQTIFASVDIQTGLTWLLPFPDKSRLPAGSFEVTGDSLWVVLGNQIEQYEFQKRQWNLIHIPMEGDPQILELKNRLYLSTSDAILEVSPETQSIQVLASARRRPALNQLDELAGYQRILASADGRLIVSVQRKIFAYSPDRRAWQSESTLPPAPVTWHGKNPIDFEKDGQPIDPFSQRIMIHPESQFWIQAGTFKLDIPEGRLVISSGLMGHWFIPKTALASNLDELNAFVWTNTPAIQKP